MRSPRSFAGVAVAMLAALLITRPADAVILQIDGTICPQSAARIQEGLNKGENGTPFTASATPPTVAGAGPKGPIDPVFDAAESPKSSPSPRPTGASTRSSSSISSKAPASRTPSVGTTSATT